MSFVTEITLKRSVEAQETRYQELVQRLIELHEDISDRAEDAYILDEILVQEVCEQYAKKLKKIIDDML